MRQAVFSRGRRRKRQRSYKTFVENMRGADLPQIMPRDLGPDVQMLEKVDGTVGQRNLAAIFWGGCDCIPGLFFNDQTSKPKTGLADRHRQASWAGTNDRNVRLVCFFGHQRTPP